MSTVPAGSAPQNDSANVPQQVPNSQSVPPSKPRPTTGKGGTGSATPKTGK